jgi:hypothetical protein
MPHIRKIIEGALKKAPIEIDAAVHEILRAKVAKIVNEKKITFSDEEPLTEDEEKTAFFEKFNDEYGHLPEAEQLEIMAKLEEEADAEDEVKDAE